MDASTAAWSVEQVKEEFPDEKGCLYLNTGSCGRKPQAVIRALSHGWSKLNVNPTLTTWFDSGYESAKDAAARFFDVPSDQLMFVQNTTQGLQFLMNNFLLEKGDEFVTTDSEHGSVNTIAQYLAETRGIRVHKVHVDPFANTSDFNQMILRMVTPKTKLVLLSEISSYTTYRPDLSILERALQEVDVPLLVDGAHAGGQIICRPKNYRLWVGSGHKWMGGPNGTGFVHVAPDLVHKLKPLWLGDEYYTLKEKAPNSVARFESNGTSDVVRWQGLEAAIKVQLRFGQENIYKRELELANYLRASVAELNPTFRTPAEKQNTAMVVMHWPESHVMVPHLRDHLWQEDQIWVQPDFMNKNPGLGIRASCHYSSSEADFDTLVAALSKVLKK